MYKAFKNKNGYSDEISHNSQVGGGLLGNLTSIMNIIPELPITNGLSNSYPSYIQNPGIPIAKSNYRQMKQQLLSQRQIFWDSEFPANAIKMPRSNYDIQWKRPFEFSRNPQLFTIDISRFDINQGKLGDCWLLAAMAALVLHKPLFEKVVPYDQTFNQGDYCGMFRFHIWYYGQWIEIIIDDLLPTSNGELVFMKSNDRNEFWSALLEKAYAKVYGSYENLKGGYTSEAMVDFSGGIIEKCLLSTDRVLMSDIRRIDALFFQLMHAFSNYSLMSCSKTGGLEERHQTGLVSRHAYSITGICLVNTMGLGQARLIRLRNPWGNETEWKGPWSDGSYEWRQVPPQELQRLQIIQRHDGEFWMAFNDFVAHFSKLEICYTNPQAMEEVGQMKNWELRTAIKDWDTNLFYGEWKAGVNAGGSRSNASYWYNPQFQLSVLEPDTGARDGCGSVIIGVMQRNLRRFNKDLISISYSVFHVPFACTNLIPPNQLSRLREVATSGEHTNLREVSCRHRLLPGNYVIIPSAHKANEERQFLVRIFSVKKTKASALDQQVECTSKEPNEMVKDKNNFDPKKVDDIFSKYSGTSQTLDSDSLLKALNKSFTLDKSYGSFSLLTAQSLIYLMKHDYAGKISAADFRNIWWYLIQWKILFKKHDVDNSGYFNTFELRAALGESGIQINNFLFEKIVQLYSQNKTECFMTFDGYIRCCVQLKSIFEQYQVYQKSTQFGPKKISLEEFIDRSLQSIIQSS